MTPLRVGAGRVVRRGLRCVRTQVESEVPLFAQAERGGLGAWTHSKPEVECFAALVAGEAESALLQGKSARSLHCTKQVEREEMAAKRVELDRGSASCRSTRR